MGTCCSKKAAYKPPQVKKTVPPTVENLRLPEQQQHLEPQLEEEEYRRESLEFNSVVPVNPPVVDWCDLDLEKCMSTTAECTTYSCTHISICIVDVASDIGDVGCAVMRECYKEDEERPPTTPMRYTSVNSVPPKGTSGGSQKVAREGSVLGISNLPLFNELDDDDGDNTTQNKHNNVASAPTMLMPTSSVQTYDHDDHFDHSKHTGRNSISGSYAFSDGFDIKKADKSRRKSY